MNCAAHPEIASVAFCRNCGRAVCDACRREWQGVPHCSDCVEKLSPAEPSFPATAESAAQETQQDTSASGAFRPSPRPAPDAASSSWRSGHSGPAPSGPVSSGMSGSWDTPSPVLAFLAGLIPGVGAVYNGQYAKGVVHALVWGGLLSAAIAAERAGPPGSVAVFVVLMVMTTLYMPIEAMHTARAIRRGEAVDEFWGLFGLRSGASSSPVAGVLLILMGVVFLLHSLGYWRLGDAARFWPVTLIALGIHLLYRRMKAQGDTAPPAASSGDALPSLRVPDSSTEDSGTAFTPQEEDRPGGGTAEEPRSAG